MKKILALFAVLLLLCGCGVEAPMISEESFFEEEQKIGTWFSLDLIMNVDTSKAELSDELEDQIEEAIKTKPQIQNDKPGTIKTIDDSKKSIQIIYCRDFNLQI